MTIQEQVIKSYIVTLVVTTANNSMEWKITGEYTESNFANLGNIAIQEVVCKYLTTGIAITNILVKSIEIIEEM